MSGMNELTGHDYISAPSFRLLLDHELAERARKESSHLCAMYDCQEPQDDPLFNRFCYEHRMEWDKTLKDLGWLDGLGVLSQSVFDEVMKDVFHES